MNYTASSSRYQTAMEYPLCGKSGLRLPRLSLGLWHNFGDVDRFDTATAMIHYAFDHGITHFDLANNYGPPYGTAEANFGRIYKASLRPYRDELIISSKAGHDMWPGPYGDGSSRKMLMASIDQSLKRTGLDYFDIFYSHRYDGITPIEETMQALVDIVKQGKALYAGISKYPAPLARKCYEYLAAHGVRCLIHQDKHNLLDREMEAEILPLVDRQGVGFISFSPLAQGLLTSRYLKDIPADSRAARSTGYLQLDQVNQAVLTKVRALNEVAQSRGESLAAMALAWVLNDKRVTSCIIGCSSVAQLQENLNVLTSPPFTRDQLKEIERICLG